MGTTARIAQFLPATAIALLATACGGGSTASVAAASAAIGGTVTGLPAEITVLLVNNGTETIGVGTNGKFTFPTKISAGGAYNLTLYTKPTFAFCEIQNGSGTVNQQGDAVTNIAVNCQAAPGGLLLYNVGVTVAGLAANKSVTFLNNGVDQLTINQNGLHIFPKQYLLESTPGGAYNITVMANPAGQTCTLTNSSGTNGAAPNPFYNFINVNASCQ